MSTDPDDLDLPPRLAEALRDAYAHRPTIPADRERLLLSSARTRFDQQARRRRLVRWTSGFAAGLAAVLAVVVWLNRPTPARPTLAGDLNADGKLDIVDALVLARHVQANDPADKAWDTNRDGRVDQNDVDTLATAAVRLQQGGLARRSLPKLHELGLSPSPGTPGVGRGVGRAGHFANVSFPRMPSVTTFAKASPTRNEEARP
jgi:hypothetical protein